MHINISRGAKPVPVPDVTNQPFANAKSALEGQGFVVQRVDVASDQPQGVVVAETPAAGNAGDEGHDGHALGLERPGGDADPRRDRRGPLDRPGDAQLGAQLNPSVIYDPVTDPSQDGIVLSMDPKPGSPATPGQTVILHVGQLTTGAPGGTGTTTTAATTTTP